MIQFSLKIDLICLGRGEEAIKKELEQLHILKAFMSINGPTLTETEKLRAISSLMFLTETWNGTIKVRACVGGRKQRYYMKKEKMSAPTVMLKSIFITAAIKAKEG